MKWSLTHVSGYNFELAQRWGVEIVVRSSGRRVLFSFWISVFRVLGFLIDELRQIREGAHRLIAFEHLVRDGFDLFGLGSANMTLVRRIAFSVTGTVGGFPLGAAAILIPILSGFSGCRSRAA